MFPSVPPTLDTNSIPGTVSNIYVQQSSEERYKTATNWIAFAEKIQSNNIYLSLVRFNKKNKEYIDKKLTKPTNPSAESAVTMLADGTVGTKLLSEIGGEFITPLTATNDSTSGTFTADEWSKLQANMNNKILFNNEIYRLNDPGHTAGIWSYVHTGWDGTDIMDKSINVTTNTGAWTLVMGQGGSSVQADYNQNDSTAANYIKNRPFYTKSESDIQKILLFKGEISLSTQISYAVDVGDIVYVKEEATGLDATDTAKFIEVAGKPYTYAGNFSILAPLFNIEDAVDTKEEYCALFGRNDNGSYMLAYGNKNKTTPNNIEVYKSADPIVRIPEKYMPLDTAKKSDTKLYQHNYTITGTGEGNYVYCTTYKRSNTPLTIQEVISLFNSQTTTGKVVSVGVVTNNTNGGTGYFQNVSSSDTYDVYKNGADAEFDISASSNMTYNIVEV